jgi:hypothetical protein
MALRTVGWVHQVQENQYMATRTAALGGTTSYHATFALAKKSLENAVGHACRSTPVENVVPPRWAATDDDGT